MNKFPNDHDDQELIAFLKKNSPLPTSADNNLEMELMNKINQLPQEKPQASHRRSLWVIPSAIRQSLALPCVIAASLLLLWGGINLLSPSPKIAQVATDEELEEFLLNGWYGAMGETSYNNAQSDFEEEWSFFSANTQ